MQKMYYSFLKWFQTPSGFELSVFYILFGVYLVVTTDSVIPFCWLPFTTYSIACVTIFICFRLINFFVVSLKYRIPKKDWAGWVQLGCITLVFILLFWTNFGLCLRLQISKRAMLEQVDKALIMNVDSQKRLFETGPVPVGLFSVRIYQIDTANKTVWFHTEDGSDIFWVPSLMGGIVYCEVGKPKDIPETSYQHLWGPWWRWAQDI